MNNRKLLEAIRANQTKLADCPKHFFDLGEPPYRFGMKVTCQNCGGFMNATDILPYAQGYKAAGGNPNEVVTNFE